MNNFVSMITSKGFTHFFVPGVLLVLWFVFTISFSSSSAFTVLEYPQSRDDYITKNYSEIYKGETARGLVLAQENNFGVISIRFNTFNRINNDEVLFRVREYGKKEWAYENKYRVDQFQPNDFFTFGFPLFNNSKSKKYEFHIESTKGKPKDAIAISRIFPQIVSKYQFSRSELIDDPINLVNFLYKKFINSFNTLDKQMSSLIYLIPFIFYIFWIKLDFYPITKMSQAKYINRSISSKHRIMLYSLFLLTLLDVFLVSQFSNSVATFIVFISWFLWLQYSRLESNFSLFLVIFFLIISLISHLFISPFFAEKSAFWAYSFLVLGVIFQFIEFKFTNKSTIESSVLINGIFEDIYNLLRKNQV